MLSLGVIGTSRKPAERRLAIHPDHVDRVEADDVVFEAGYGERFGVSDAALGARTAPREEVMQADVVLLPKPLTADLQELREGQVLWGWPHAVQDVELAQTALDRRLTLIAWEAMNHWKHGRFDVHVFHKNNELAGYCSVLHALSLIGRTGDYGPRMRAAVISFGATGRGAVRGLAALGISDITVFTQRDVAAVASPFASVRMEQFDRDDQMGETLAGFDVVVNCILQDPLDPVIFIRDEDLPRYRPGTLFVDVSCDEGMGFEWAQADVVRRPGLRRRRRLHLLRSGPQPVVPVGVEHLGDQRGAARLHPDRPRRPGRLGRRRDDPPRDRDPRRPHLQPRRSRVPEPRAGPALRHPRGMRGQSPESAVF